MRSSLQAEGFRSRAALGLSESLLLPVTQALGFDLGSSALLQTLSGTLGCHAVRRARRFGGERAERLRIGEHWQERHSSEIGELLDHRVTESGLFLELVQAVAHELVGQAGQRQLAAVRIEVRVPVGQLVAQLN